MSYYPASSEIMFFVAVCVFAVALMPKFNIVFNDMPFVRRSR